MSAVALLPFLTLATAQAANATPLQPSGRWVVDFGNSRCIAARNFGPESNPVHLLIKPSPIGDVLQMSLTEAGHKPTYAEQEHVTLTFDAGEPLSLWQLHYSADGRQVRTINLTKEQASRLAEASSLNWTAPLKRYEISIGPMNDLIKVVDECRASLADYWNATPEKDAALKSRVTMDRPVISLFSSDDYPAQALSKDQSGQAHVVALIDEKGSVVDCTVIETSGIAALDAQTCIIMRKRGKFTPAIGADGKSTKGIFTQRIRWEMSN